jgi:hypothetical protein
MGGGTGLDITFHTFPPCTSASYSVELDIINVVTITGLLAMGMEESMPQGAPIRESPHALRQRIERRPTTSKGASTGRSKQRFLFSKVGSRFVFKRVSQEGHMRYIVKT